MPDSPCDLTDSGDAPVRLSERDKSVVRSAARGHRQRALVARLVDQGHVRIEAATLDESVVNLVHRIRGIGYHVVLRPLEAPGTAEVRAWELRLCGHLTRAEQAVFLGGDPATAARVKSALAACGAEPDVALVTTVYALLSGADAPHPGGDDRLVELRASVQADHAVVTAIYVHDVEAPRVVAVQVRADEVAQAIGRLEGARRAMIAAEYASERGLTVAEVFALRERRRATSDEWCEASVALDEACALPVTRGR